MPIAARGLVALLGLALLGGCGADRDPQPAEPSTDFRVELLGGGALRLSDLRGSWVLLDFWATWCAPCVAEVPELNALHQARAGDDFVVLGISVDEPGADVAGWVRQHGVRYRVGFGSEELARTYGAFGFPFHVLITPDGGIAERLPPGFHDRADFEAILARHGA